MQFGLVLVLTKQETNYRITTMAEVFIAEPSYYVLWRQVVFRVTVHAVEGQFIWFAEIVAFIGDPLMPPESDII